MDFSFVIPATIDAVSAQHTCFPGTHAQNHADRNSKHRQARGERQGHSRLTEAAVLEIRASRHVSSAVLAAKFKVHRNTVLDVRSGKNWKHV